MANEDLAQRVVDRYKKLLQKRDPWRTIYKLLAKYVLLRTMVFGDQVLGKSPTFSVKDVADDEVIEAAQTASTALCGALWPNAAESFELVPLPKDSTPAAMGIFEDDTQDEQKYCEKITRTMRDRMDAPESGFLIAWSEYMGDQPVFGTSGMFGVEDEENDMQPFSFRSINVETCVIDEGADGLVNTVYLEYQFTVRQMVEKYGEDKLSEKTQALARQNQLDDWVKVIRAIEPRRNGKAGDTVDNKPIASIEVEVDNNHVIENGGFDEQCVWIVRMIKRPNEIYGRSLGMLALATLRELNILRTGFTKALDKILDPPVGFDNEQVGGAGNVNLSAGAKVALFKTGRISQSQKAVEPLITVQEPRVASERLKDLVERVKTKFLVDKLLDFNNKTRMTLGEAELRNDFRNQALNPIFVRQLFELLFPLIVWACKVMFRRGMLGLHPGKDAQLIEKLRDAGQEPLVIPTRMAALLDKGRLPFAVRFISPAARAMKAEGLMGIEKVTNYAITLAAAGVTDAMDNLDVDKTIRMYTDLSGAPSTMLRSPDEIEKIRAARQEALAQQAELQQAQQMAMTAGQGARAMRDFTAAGNGK